MADADESVRPPDLSSGDLPDELDPLEGWDLGPAPVVPPPPPPDGAVVAAGAVAGLLLGAVAARGSRLGSGLLGALLGAAVAMVARRAWELDPPDDRWARELTGTRFQV